MCHDYDDNNNNFVPPLPYTCRDHTPFANEGRQIFIIIIICGALL